MNKRKEKIKRNNELKLKGQKFLTASLIVNSLLVINSIHISNLDEKYQDMRDDEYYFIMNQQSISNEMQNYYSMHADLNQLKILRRMGKKNISEIENKTLIKDEKEMQRKVSATIGKILGATYLQANEPPPGQHPDKMFDGYTDDEKVELTNKYNEQAYEYAASIKEKIINFKNKSQYFKKFQFVGLIINSIIILLGTRYLHKAEI